MISQQNIQRNKNRTIANQLSVLAKDEIDEKYRARRQKDIIISHKGLYYPPKQQTERIKNRQHIKTLLKTDKMFNEYMSKHPDTCDFLHRKMPILCDFLWSTYSIIKPSEALKFKNSSSKWNHVLTYLQQHGFLFQLKTRLDFVVANIFLLDILKKKNKNFQLYTGGYYFGSQFQKALAKRLIIEDQILLKPSKK